LAASAPSITPASQSEGRKDEEGKASSVLYIASALTSFTRVTWMLLAAGEEEIYGPLSYLNDSFSATKT
jgi:hypothetical protein